ncbi:MAG: prepilin-type N-terminal cleavage/methylation domain-containing protein [Cyanobacteria bacterium J06642_2]
MSGQITIGLKRLFQRCSQHSAQDRIELGFTLVELLVAVAIASVLSSVAVPTFLRSVQRARIAAVAKDLDGFAAGVQSYALLNGGYPPDNHNDYPPGTEGYLNTAAFNLETPIGGRYNWEGPDLPSNDGAGIALFASPASVDVLEALDGMLDDGDLATGRFIMSTKGRPTLILDDCTASYSLC